MGNQPPVTPLAKLVAFLLFLINTSDAESVYVRGHTIHDDGFAEITIRFMGRRFTLAITDKDA